MKRYVITHPKGGVYLGTCLGLGFWTLYDPVGQDHAVVFETPEKAWRFIDTWNSRDIYLQSVIIRHVECALPDYATIDELKEAGLGDLLGDMETNALRYAITVGNA